MTFEDAGPNEGLVEDLYEQYRVDPSSVPERWRDVLRRPARRERPAAGRTARTRHRPAPAPDAAPPPPPAPQPPPQPAPAPPAAPASTDESRPLRGVHARIAQNMEASLAVPTATSVRSVPAKLLEVNRQILNNHLESDRARQGQLHPPHRVRRRAGAARLPEPLLELRGRSNGTPTVVRHPQVNLGLAVDVERPDGSRSLLVPEHQGRGDPRLRRVLGRVRDGDREGPRPGR